MQRATPRADSGRPRGQRSKAPSGPVNTPGTNGRNEHARAAPAETLDKRERLGVLAAELRRLSRAVGEEGRTDQRATLGGVQGAWAESVDSVNSLIVNLSSAARPT